MLARCCKYQYLKEQKQFTTSWQIQRWKPRMLQISVFKRTKAIHNHASEVNLDVVDVANISI